MSIVKDPSLAPDGRLKIEWAEAHMPVLRKIRERVTKKKLFKGISVGLCMHLEMKTAVLAQTFSAAGASVAITGSNPLSTQDDVAAALLTSGVTVYDWHGVSLEDHQKNLLRVLDHKPDVIVDDGAELGIVLHKERPELLGHTLGACEETTTGVTKFRAMEKNGALRFPVIAVNDAFTKYLFDSQYGTGQSCLDGIMRATNILIAGKTVVVGGYGWVGRGIANRARGMGATVIVTEVDAVRAVEATMEGFRVMPMLESAALGDIFVTATGCRDIITEKHFNRMKDGTILANSGHYDVEIDVRSLERTARSRRVARNNVEEFRLKNGRKLYLLARGRLVNLAAADGHPAEVMDMSFANQALAAEYLLSHKSLDSKVYRMPVELDREVARLFLETARLKIDVPTPAQIRYMQSWE